MSRNGDIIEQLAGLLSWEDAHVGFDRAVERLPFSEQGKRPEGLPYSAWELLEHIRITQADILNFCVNPEYTAPNWPDDYWPVVIGPADEKLWGASVAAVKSNRQTFVQFLRANADRLLERIPNGEGQTLFREAVLIADHTSYHLGQLIVVRRILGQWE